MIFLFRGEYHQELREDWLPFFCNTGQAFKRQKRQVYKKANLNYLNLSKKKSFNNNVEEKLLFQALAHIEEGRVVDTQGRRLSQTHNVDIVVVIVIVVVSV